MDQKQCLYCKQEIHKDATRCPHCRSWQSKFLPDPQSPRGFILVMLGVFLVMGLIIGATEYYKASKTKTATASGQAYSSMTITKSEMVVHDCVCAKCFSIFGEIQNPTKTAWKRVSVYIEVFDSKGALIDTSSEQDSDLIIFANSKKAFRYTRPLMRKPEDYSSHKIFITGAEAAQ